MSANHQAGRLARWVLRLQEFDFTIRHKPGKANTNVDALSRLPNDTFVIQPSDVPILAVGPDTIALPTRDEIRQQQVTDPLLHDVLDFLKHPQTREASPEVKQVLRDTGTISIDSSTGLLMHTTVVNGRRCHVPILPPATHLVAMKALHGLPIAGHLGYKSTYHRIRAQFYWKDMAQDIKTFVRSCLPCQSRKPPPPRHSGHLQLFSASHPFETVGVDIFGPLPRTTHGNRYEVVMVDRFSRWTEFAPVPDITSTTATVADAFVNSIILRHGCPNHVIPDRGSKFTSNFFRALQLVLVSISSLPAPIIHRPMVKLNE